MASQTQQPSGSRLNRSGINSLATTSGTQTQTQTQTPSTRPILVLRAEGAETRHIQWAENVVDNEGMGKKSSKVCCIYHKPHSADESSEDESSSDSDSDSEPDTSKARPAGGLKDRKKKQKHGHDHDHDHKHDGEEGSSRRRPSPNAYERVPKYKQPAQTEPSASRP